MFTPVKTSQLHTLLESGVHIVTANQRLARFRLKQYESTQLKQGKAAWHTPQILAWQVWLQEQWLSLGEGVLLSIQQEMLFWRDAVAQDELTPVLNPKSLSKQAMDAWSTLADYAINPSCLLGGGEEYAALHRWAEEVQQKVSVRGQDFVQRHQVLKVLSNISEGKKVPKSIVLDGFDTFSPAQVTFLEKLESLGSEIFVVSQSEEKSTPSLQLYHDEESELRHICQHIRKVVAQNPEGQIGVFIPDLEQRAALVSQILSEELAPTLSLQTDIDLQGQFFNLSLGSVLAKQPMIQAALALLSLTLQQKLDYQTISSLLLNPYLQGHDDEAIQRANLDVFVRAQNNHHITLKQLLSLAQHADIKTPLFDESMTKLTQHIFESKKLKGKQLLSTWMLSADEILSNLLWHDMAKSAHEFAQLQGWKDMIHQLSSLDDFCGSLSWAEALGRLQEHAFEQLFRPAPGLAKIHVMGFLEASNLRFDEAFILSMDDNTWPPAAKPHPLIPVDVQVLHQTPHANSEREWQYAQHVWGHLLHVSPKLHVSYARTRDKQDVQPSPLLNELSKIEDIPFESFRYATQLQSAGTTLENIQHTAKSVAEDESIRGGTGILAAQSACSFQAFAKYRLKLEGIETPTKGLNSREQGTLLHKVLELFWLKYSSQKQLIDLIDAKILDGEIKTCIEKAWTSLHRLIPSDIKWLEERRLQSLIHAWLLLEAERTPFRVVENEQWRDLKLGDLVLHTRLDRVDADANGHRITLDYKTGESIAGKALGERPDAPQLPAYLVAEEDKGLTVDALAFAQVRYQGMGFKGFSQESDVLTGIKAFKGRAGQPEGWDELTQHWRETLNTLADEFMAGEATLTPKNTQSCTYCDFEGLCRIKGN